jgi:alpha-tubulin suppressor-like RCC1 family protein
MCRKAITQRAIIWCLVVGLLLLQAPAQGGAEAAPQVGFALAWGENWSGQLGDGLPKFRPLPGPVSGPAPGAFPPLAAFSAGYQHNLILARDGRMLTWGGVRLDPVGTPIPVVDPTGRSLPGVVAVATGVHFSLALDSGGLVYSWRDGSPQLVSGLDGVAALSAGTHSLALRRDGTVWSWGPNYQAQLGDGTITNERPTPAPVIGLQDIVAIAAGAEHSLALRRDGTIWAWGRNEEGQLGEATRTVRTTPVAVPGLVGVVAIAAGERHSLALLADGTVRAWGNNDNGQVGDGSDERLRLGPREVMGLGEVAAIAAGTHHSVALRRDGTAWAWGSNFLGQLGDGTLVDRRVPVPVQQLGAAQAIGAGGTLALLRDGSLQSWGDNHLGQLGIGVLRLSATPVPVVGTGGTGTLGDLVAIEAGGDSGLAVRQDGVALGWGIVVPGQGYPDGDREQPIPQPLPLPPGVVSLSTGYGHTLALLRDGRVLAWGRNEAGQLGDGTVTPRRTPVEVPGLGDVVEVRAGVLCSFALLRDGTVRAWGWNSDGRLGIGQASPPQTRPIPVPDLQDVATLSIGQGNHLALLRDGTVLAWDWRGSARPMAEPRLRDVRALAAGGGHNLALLADGTVWGWGNNSYGALGNPEGTDTRSPVPVPGLHDVVALAARSNHCVALLADGTLRAWGWNNRGQLGDGTRTTRWSPVPVRDPGGAGILRDVIAIDALAQQTLALVAVAPNPSPRPASPPPEPTMPPSSATPVAPLPGLPNTGMHPTATDRVSVMWLLPVATAIWIVTLALGGWNRHHRRRKDGP